ncbi:cysteine desulfurase family protein [Lutibaculum baratangense]|uniref:Cysteine desulfurase n=1 Tax=Lutibaculum baratangense AMV1 TaxID=631454 RepID=V4RG18_9HYPH|nr:cysteine desulfurase family protein [Lutibaculum baratangense]ESR25091.1 Cysteine desulfurase [Lutibaculum baratangense AMV1]
MSGFVYLDCNATSPLRPQARAAMLAAIEDGGNPSSVHMVGRRARRHLEDARVRLAAVVGAEPADVVMTSGGTEANALALAQARGAPVLVSAVEHPSVLAAVPDAEIVPVDGQGVVDLRWLALRLGQDPKPGLVSIMAANNETGVLQPLDEIRRLCGNADVPLHSDAVQVAGRMRADDLPADLVTLSSHKMGGPLGAGALVRKGGPAIVSLVRGGGQERGLRGGTENVPAIAGFGAAAAAAMQQLEDRRSELERLRDWFEREISTICAGTRILGAQAPRLPNTSCFAVPGVAAETALIALDLEGIAVSSGSACSSGKVGVSHVLAAMNVAPELAAGAIRVSLGWSTTGQDLENFVSVWRRVGPRLAGRKRQPRAA